MYQVSSINAPQPNLPQISAKVNPFNQKQAAFYIKFRPQKSAIRHNICFIGKLLRD
jgi:hypothetical protein